MITELERQLSGEAVEAIDAFYRNLPRIPRARWPEMIHGLGYNFEFYDALFAVMIANLQLSFEVGDYTARYRAMQHAILPFCSEFGLDLGRPLARTHRELYAEFYRAATGQEHPERYPAADAGNPWLAASRRWAERMSRRVACPGEDALFRARFNVGYCWAVEHLSVAEFSAMRAAWNEAGVRAPYLDAHCEVEEAHDSYSSQALLAFAGVSDPAIISAVRTHEADLAGFYRDLRAITEA